MSMKIHNWLFSFHCAASARRTLTRCLVLGTLFLVAARVSLAQTADSHIAQGRTALAAHDLATANARFAQAVGLVPNNQTANALYGVTRVLVLFQQPIGSNFLTRLGLPAAGRNLYDWTAIPPRDTNSVPLAPAGVNASEAVAMLRTNVLPEITAAIVNLAKVVDTNFTLALTSGETTLADVTLDYGDILLLRSLFHGAEYAGYMLNAQNLDAQLSALRTLYDADHLTIERVLRNYPQLLTFATTNDLVAAREAFGRGVDDYQAASTFILNRPSGLTRLFNLDPGSDGDQANFRQNLLDLKASLNGPVVLTTDYQYTVHAARHFQNPQPWRSFLPQFLGDSLVLGSLPDLTFGGQFIGTKLDEVEEGLSMVLSCVPVVTHVEHFWGQAFQFYSRVVPDHGYVVQVSSNLLAWQDLGAFIALDWTAGFSDPAGPATSQRFYRLVDRTGNLPPPANDNFVNRVVLTGYGNAVVGYNESASRELGEPAGDSYSAGRTVWYSWTAPANGPVAVSVQTSSSSYFYPRIGVFTGSTLASLVQVATGSRQLVFNAVAGTTYQIAVDGYAWGRGPTGGFQLVIARPPVLTLSSPTNGAAFAAPANVLISGAVTPGDGSSVVIDIRGSGTTNLDLSLPGLTFAYWWTNLPSGSYQVSVNVVDSLGVSASTNVNFRVPPTNDNFTNRIPITGSLPRVITGSNRGAGVELGEPTHAGYSPYNSVWWSWTAPQSGSITIECWGSRTEYYGTWPFSAALAVYTGNALTNLSVVASNYPSFWGFPSLVRFPVVAGSIYQIALDGSGNEGDLRLLLTTNAPPTVTLTSPAEGGQFVGPTNLLLNATASGSAPITRMDFYNGSSLIGSISNSPYTLIWSNVASSPYAYQITARATDSAGLVGYASANVTVAAPPPPNDNFSNRALVSGGGFAVNGSTYGATPEPGEPYHAGYYPSHSAWWSWTAPSTGQARLQLAITNDYTFPRLAVYTGANLSSLTVIASADYGSVWPYNTVTLPFNTIAGTVYQIAADCDYWAGFSLQMTFLGQPPSVAITSPLDGQRVVAPPGATTNVTVNVSASDPDGTISNLSVYGDGQLLGQTAGSSLSLVWSNVGWGSHSISATATDNMDAQGQRQNSFSVGGPEYTVRTFAGPVEPSGAVDATGSAARFNGPNSVAADAAGNVYVADSQNHTVRKITPSGAVTTLAGLAGYPGYADGKGGAARFSYPQGVAVDTAGNVYVAESYCIRKITPDGAVSTLAGGGNNWGSADGVGSTARFNGLSGVAVDSAGNVYVADMGNHTIRKITSAGVVSTLAGLAGNSGSSDGTGSVARFNNPRSVAVDGASNIYVADYYNHTIRKITPAGVVTTLAGLAGYQGSTDANGSAARFSYPQGVAVDAGGNVYVADSNNSTIRKITPGSAVSTLAGLAGYRGGTDDTGSAARFYYPRGLAVGTTTNIFVADSGTIRRITLGAVVSTLVGMSGAIGKADGLGNAARFAAPSGVAVDGGGTVFVADSNNRIIRKISSAGLATTLAGSGNLGSADGPSNTATFSWPLSVAVDGSTNVYVADRQNHTIRKITPAGIVSTLAGLAGSSGTNDGTGSAARFSYPSGVAANAAGTVYVADTYNHTIRMITPSGVVSTLAGLSGASGSADGLGSTARFYNPSGVAVDTAGNVYVADTSNATIRKITPGGVVSTLAGLAGYGGNTDNTGSAARFSYPNGVAVDAAGNAYVADTFNSTIRRITPAGVVSTLAGFAGNYGGADGIEGSARFNQPNGVAVDASGNVYVADMGNSSIRFITTNTLSDMPIISPAQAAVGVARQLDASPQTATGWTWSLIRRPTGSVAALSSTSIRNPTFTPDVKDSFVFRLVATNSTGSICIRTLELKPDNIQ